MGKVYTTSEDLTSIADAIRAKGRTNSSLVYPSGFVSAIENIQGDVWDGYGANPEVLYTQNYDITLDNTNISSITPSTTEQAIYNISATTLNNIATDTHDLYLSIIGYIRYKYKQELQQDHLYDYFAYIAIANNAATYGSMRDNEQHNWQYKRVSNNKLTAAYNAKGITIYVGNLMSVTTTSITIPEIVLKLELTSNYFTNDILSQLDLTNTHVILQIKCTQYTGNSTRYHILNKKNLQSYYINLPD